MANGNRFATLVALFAALGAFLFGLDIGYIASILVAPSFKRDVAHLPDWQDPRSQVDGATEGFIVAIFSLGCIVAASPAVSAYFLDEWGRKPSILVGSVVFVVGAVLQGAAKSLAHMLVGRFIAGLSIGLLSAVVALYQSELSPPAMRGTLTSFYQLMITFGVATAAVMNFFLVDREGGWRVAIFLQVVPALLLMGGMTVLPGSPRWLVQKGRIEEARKTLQIVRETDEEAEDELMEIMANCERDAAAGSAKWEELLAPRLRKLVMLGVALQLLQQFVGMNAFMYFGPKVFQAAGGNGTLLQAICCAINFLATFPAILLADGYGRTSLLQTGAALMGLSCLVMGIAGAICMARVGNDWQSQSAVGSVVIVLTVYAFVASFSFSWGPMVWVYCAEMFPLKHRSRCMGVVTMANWVGNYCIAQFTPVLLQRIGFSTFYLFAVFSVAGFLLARWLPETKGVHLELIDKLFDEKLGASPQPPAAKDPTYGATKPS